MMILLSDARYSSRSQQITISVHVVTTHVSSYHPPILRVTTLVGSNFEKRLAFHNSQKQISRDELVKIKHEDFTLDINNIMNVYSKDNASNFVYLDKLTT